MLLRKPFALLVLAALAGTASANSVVGTTDALGRGLKGSVNVITDTTKGTFNAADSKIVAAAREDAASFVASGGEIHSVQLQAALEHLRRHNPDVQISDMQLAEAILNH